MRRDPTQPIFHLLALGIIGSPGALLAHVGQHWLALEGRVWGLSQREDPTRVFLCCSGIED